MKLKKGLSYMLAGSALTLGIWGLSKNEKVRSKALNVIDKIKNTEPEDLEDMM